VCRKLGDDPEIDSHVSQWDTKVDQQSFLAGLLGQQYREYGGDGGDPASALGAHKYE
jgi:hypothetical protein